MAKHWYTLRAKPKRESAAATLLANTGIEVFLPQAMVLRSRGKAPSAEPFFPGYLFARLDPAMGDIRLAKYTSGILYIVGYGDEPWPLPEELVGSIRERLAKTGGRPEYQEFRPGDRLIVTSGPLRDVEAIFDRHLSATGRVRVLIQVLERLYRTELHIGQVKRISKAAAVA